MSGGYAYLPLRLLLALIVALGLPACGAFGTKPSPALIPAPVVQLPPVPGACLVACPPLALDQAINEAEDEAAVHVIIGSYELCQRRNCACILALQPIGPAAKFCRALPDMR